MKKTKHKKETSTIEAELEAYLKALEGPELLELKKRVLTDMINRGEVSIPVSELEQISRKYPVRLTIE